MRVPQQVFELVELPETAQALADGIGMAASLAEPEAAAYQIDLAYRGTKV